MSHTPSHRAWALARLAQIREVAEERRRWAEVQQRRLLPADAIDAEAAAVEAEAARLEDARLQARRQRLAAARDAELAARARGRVLRQARAEAPVIVPEPVAPPALPARRWDRAKQRWVKEPA